jgi:hypothetical protein
VRIHEAQQAPSYPSLPLVSPTLSAFAVPPRNGCTARATGRDYAQATGLTRIRPGATVQALSRVLAPPLSRSCPRTTSERRSAGAQRSVHRSASARYRTRNRRTTAPPIEGSSTRPNRTLPSAGIAVAPRQRGCGMSIDDEGVAAVPRGPRPSSGGPSPRRALGGASGSGLGTTAILPRDRAGRHANLPRAPDDDKPVGPLFPRA